jgi:hypothetical protein
MSNDKGQMTKEIRMTKPENGEDPAAFGHSGFVIRHSGPEREDLPNELHRPSRSGNRG